MLKTFTSFAIFFYFYFFFFKKMTENVFEIYKNRAFVFKRCTSNRNDYDCLVILEKPKENFKCNEERSGIVDKNFAKFRCNGLITVGIYDLFHKKFIDKLEHTVYIDLFFYTDQVKITYQVGTITIPDDYNEDAQEICTNGIHYFLNLEAALNYKKGRVTYYKDKKVFVYDHNGNVKIAIK